MPTNDKNKLLEKVLSKAQEEFEEADAITMSQSNGQEDLDQRSYKTGFLKGAQIMESLARADALKTNEILSMYNRGELFTREDVRREKELARATGYKEGQRDAAKQIFKELEKRGTLVHRESIEGTKKNNYVRFKSDSYQALKRQFKVD